MKNFRYSGIEVDPLTGFKKKTLKCIFSSQPKNGKPFQIINDENRFFDVIIRFYRRLLFKIKSHRNYHRYKFIIQSKKFKIHIRVKHIF